MRRETVTIEVDSWFALGLADFLEEYESPLLGRADVGDTCPHDADAELENVVEQLRSQT